ncbi:MAG: hypothetical protein LQ344_004665 [Seirophora lacunosa]|nr:MAG: hypothetical protein LQ344_004665 [Seirophora lacunosa]
MAYNSGYNPDALPAHAEPEQAARILSSQQHQQGRPSVPPISNPASHANPQPYNQQQPYQNTQQQPYQNTQQQPYQNTQQQPYQNTQQQPYQNTQQQPYQNTQQQPYQNKPQPPMPQPVQQLNTQYASRPPQTNTPTNTYNYAGSPPSQNYGFGPPPKQHHGRSPPLSRPPPTPAPPTQSSQDASLFPLFKAVDKTGTGQLTEKELRAALVNGDYTSFDPHTVKMMIRMFDADKSGTIKFDEFCGLWGFLAAWRSLFDRFDEDRSGYISFSEYSNALVAFGYRLSPTFVGLLYRTYEKNGKDMMSFDLFVQSCIVLKRMTDVFKKYDEDRDGYITLSFEEFLTGRLDFSYSR